MTPPRRRLAPDRMYPAGAAGIAVRYVVVRTGERLRVAEAGPPNGTPVLLVHGWGASLYNFRHALPALAAAGHRAIAVDLRGHGLSEERPGGGGYGTDDMVAHLADVIEALALDCPIVAGHSMAGRVALELAMSRPESVRAVAMLASAGFSSLHMVPFVTQPLLRLAALVGPKAAPRFAIALVLRAVYGRLRDVPEEDIDQYWAPTQFRRYLRAIHGLLRHFQWGCVDTAEVAALAVPLLVMLGECDRLLGVSDPEKLARQIAPHRVVAIEGAGHVITDEAPDDVNRELLALVARSVEWMAPPVTTG